MADVITTLHPEGAPEDNLYPNVKIENLPFDVQEALNFVLRGVKRKNLIQRGDVWNTGISSASHDGGGTVLVLYSNNSSGGDSTSSEVGIIRLGYDGNHATYYSIYKSNPTYTFASEISVSSVNDELVLSGIGILINKVTLIYGGFN